jgi:hypothetical protein
LKSRKVNTVASDEELVRLNIYDGEIPLGDAGARLLELALAQHHRGGAMLGEIHRVNRAINEQMEMLRTPWPVRWWRWFRDSDRRKS